MDFLNEFVLFAGDLLWTWAVLPVLAILGVYFTVRTGVVQFRLIPEMFRTLTDKTPLDDSGKPQSVSAFQAFTVSAASRVGVGNIAGVGTAIAIGGPGAVFWMWSMAFIGGASSFVESTLGQLYKVKDADGFRGGPAYYMQHGLKARWMGILFAVVLIICFPFAFSSLAGQHHQRDDLLELRRRGRLDPCGRRRRARPAHRPRHLRRHPAHRLASPRRSCPPWPSCTSCSVSSSSA